MTLSKLTLCCFTDDLTVAVHVSPSYKHGQLPAYHGLLAFMPCSCVWKCLSRLYEMGRASGVLSLLFMLQTNTVYFSVTGLGNLSGSLTIIAKFEPVSAKRVQITYESAALVCFVLTQHTHTSEQLRHVCCYTYEIAHCSKLHANVVNAPHVFTLCFVVWCLAGFDT